MDDPAYAAELIRILTNPHPTGIRPDDPYGQADDGIDRYSGFGRDVVVTGGRVVGGEYGSELEIDFVIRPDGEPEIADRGRVSLDAGWRELSGYADPSAYAPRVAREVERAARETWRRHSGRSEDGQADRRAVPARAEEQRALLLELLGREGLVTEAASPDRFEVSCAPLEDEPGLRFTVVVTPAEWAGFLESVGPENAAFGELMGSARNGETFLVFWKGEFEQSVREELPPVRARPERFVFPEGAGGWYAYRPRD
ncbi:hypothetical protein [Nocardioides jiangxiensis]|uniref:Uncharacterized protein n=1 Tax=Nocardioides jiangxiensis TaxID=3064524 RepID=A0ABT9AXD6_9ACTN|nr:hypothetical protein [Nocardioides sp. WY-20]MDO7867199.1 hypothetical protein [Nocardioides sp. WY-20]